MFLVVPIFGRHMMPHLARGGVTIALALPVMAHVAGAKPTGLEVSALRMLGLSCKELLLGYALGVPVSAAIWAMEAAGSFVDEQRGASLQAQVNPTTGHQTSPIGIFMSTLYTAWLIITGGLSDLLAALYHSYLMWPLWSFQPSFGPRFISDALTLADDIMRLTLLISGPAIVAMFLSEFGLALIGRFAPQLQVFYAAMSVKSIVGLLLLMFSLTIVLSDAANHAPSPIAFVTRLTK
ncbi:type III secretion system export apparatus subunit SctT (plasmid) [Bradyrhizobium sp. 62B]|nr:type III secretion system export apparatus subunit SctT [Bradyrhizobium sp. 62B]